MNKYLISIILINFLILSWSDVFSQTMRAKQTRSDSVVVIKVSIDRNQSVVKWKGTEMRGRGSHQGTLQLSEGYLEFQNARLTGGEFVADMNTIIVTDIPKSDPIPRRNLREHLESKDFFLVEKYPTARFQIVQTEYFESDSARIDGNLTIRDMTKPVSFIAHQNEVNGPVKSYRASFKFNRFEWNISYQGSFWKRITSIIDNTFVDADISLSIELVTLPFEYQPSSETES